MNIFYSKSMLNISLISPKSNLLEKNTPSTAIVSQSTLLTRVIIAGLILFVLIFLPTFIHQQMITGPLVNASLLLASVVLGPAEAMLLGLLPSTVALSRGLLPVALSAMVPFIMISNALYILVFDRFYKKTALGAVLIASTTKFLFLFTISQRILAVLLPANFLTKVASMMSWPQLITALIGGLIAHLIIRKRLCN